MSALVIDIGSSSLRAGYAGDDTPKAIIPTSYGFKQELSTDGDITMGEGGEAGEGATRPAGKVKLYIGQNGPSVWRENMEIANPISDSLGTPSKHTPVCRLCTERVS